MRSQEWSDEDLSTAASASTRRGYRDHDLWRRRCRDVPCVCALSHEIVRRHRENESFRRCEHAAGDDGDDLGGTECDPHHPSDHREPYSPNGGPSSIIRPIPVHQPETHDDQYPASESAVERLLLQL
jgi:hypothetical protein